MAQLEKTRRSSESPRTPRTPTSPTFEQLLRVEDAHFPTSSSPTFGINHDQEEYLMSPSHHKKSVLTLVKERAKKLRHSLSGKKKQVNGSSGDNSPPSWGVTLDDDDDGDDNLEQEGDPEYLGAPMYESEAAPENLKETARQHPRADPVVSEKHVLSKAIKCEAIQGKEEPLSPSKTMTETVSEKLAPAYAAMSGATHNIASKLANLTVTTPEPQEKSTGAVKIHGGPPAPQEMSTASVKIHGEPRENARNAAHNPISLPANNEIMDENTGNMKKFETSSPQKWDKGVSVKEYFMNKLEPGDDEKALSEAITEAISPRRTTGDTGVVEKVKEAVTSLFWHEEPPNSMGKAVNSSSSVPLSMNIPSVTPQRRVSSANAPYSTKASYSANDPYSTNPPSNVSMYKSANSSPQIPVSTSAHEVLEEENHGKILQAN